MKLKVLGAAGTVTGSSYILTSDSGQSILIDMGMFQGPKEIEQMNYLPYDYDVSKLSGALLTHAHLDHCGRLPMLETMGFSGQIWMTSPTKELAKLVLYDSARIAEKDPDRALYTQDHVESLANRFKTKDFNDAFEIGDFEVTFIKAGHLLGAASIVIKDTSSQGDIKTIVFSGDLGNDPEELLQAKAIIKSADLVIMESTYGDKIHNDANAYDLLQAEINAVEAKNSTLLIPSFSLEKTQELLHMIKHLKEDKKVDPLTVVYMDSPMAQTATQIYESFIDYANQHIRDESSTTDPFSFPGIEVISSHQDSQKIHETTGTKVIIAGAGMMTGGRIVGHAAKYLENPDNRLFFVGYQGEDTLGRQILEGAKFVKIGDTKVEVKAHIGKTDGMSAHADQGQLIEWLRQINGVKKVVLTHGDEIPRAGLAQKIEKDLGIKNLVLPYLNQEIDL